MGQLHPGKMIIMGDADLTYDFRDLSRFVAAFRKGAECIMGSWFQGSIEGGMVGFQTFCFTLLLEMAQRVAPEREL